ncbi:Ig-like domain-containing protein, partial [uncultured Polaribacter sp.]|uniref:DUF7507 domain-containing protein n=1 Tax=uncultured Polaribacter sp. TaxID=174711 RepID=UPI002612928E
MRKMYTLFNLKINFNKNTLKLFLFFAFILNASSFTYAQGVTIVVNTTTASDTGAEEAGNTIDYSVAVKNTGGIPLTNINVASSLTLSPALTLESGDDDNDNILDADESWVYTGSYIMTAADVTATKVDNTFSVTSTEITIAETFTHSENVHEDDISFASVFVINDIIATNDDFSSVEVDGVTGGTAGNVFSNDTVNAITATATTVSPSIVSDGGLTGVNIATDGSVNVPSGTSSGTYTVSYKICDAVNVNNCEVAEITIEVANVAPVAVNDGPNSTLEDTPITILSIGANDTDAEDTTPDASTIILIDPDNASNTGSTGTPLIVPNVGTYTIDANGDLNFVPVDDFNGPANVNYTIKDSEGLVSSNVGVVSITVISVNDGPVADDESVSTNEDTPITVDVLDGDT